MFVRSDLINKLVELRPSLKQGPGGKYLESFLPGMQHTAWLLFNGQEGDGLNLSAAQAQDSSGQVSASAFMAGPEQHPAVCDTRPKHCGTPKAETGNRRQGSNI